MREKIKKLTVIIAFIILLWIILANSNSVSKNIIIGFDLWVTKVLPSLFPMFVISDVLINYGLANHIGRIFRKITLKLFKVSGEAAYVMGMSLISGTPSNAIFVKELHSQKILNEKEASKILSFTFFTNPIFLYSFLNLIMPGYNSLVLIIIIVVYSTNILIGFLFRNLEADVSKENYQIIKNNQSFTNIFTNSIKKAMNNLIMILGTIIFFIMLSAVINEIITIGPFNTTILKGILEITGGLNSLITLDAPIKIKAIIATMLVSFGGISIHMQIKSIIADTNISFKPFFIARIIHAIIASSIIYLIVYATI